MAPGGLLRNCERGEDQPGIQTCVEAVELLAAPVNGGASAAERAGCRPRTARHQEEPIQLLLGTCARRLQQADEDTMHGDFIVTGDKELTGQDLWGYGGQQRTEQSPVQADLIMVGDPDTAVRRRRADPGTSPRIRTGGFVGITLGHLQN